MDKMHREDSDQTGQMPKLIRVFTGHTDHFVGFVVLWLICHIFNCRSSSVLGSFGTPSSGEDVKARMMNRLKESTAKANISSLFNRKK